MRAGALSLALMELLLTSCIYNEITYLKPIGPGGYFYTACHGPDNTLGFKLHDELGMKIYTGGRKIAFVVHLGQGHLLQLQDHEVLISNIQGAIVGRKSLAQFMYDEYQRFESERQASVHRHEPVAKLEEIKSYQMRNEGSFGIFVNATYAFPPTVEFRGRSGYEQKTILGILGQDLWETFSVYTTELDVSDIELDKYVLRFPSVNLDGLVIIVPSITMEKVTEYVRSNFC